MVWPTIERHARLRRRAAACAAAVVLMANGGCSAHGRDSETAADTGITFACSAEAFKSAEAGLTESAICALFKAEIDRALGLTMTEVSAGAAMPATGDWIMVRLGATSPVTVSAAVSQRIAGVEASLPDMAVDVSDKPVGLSDIGMLAAQVATTIAEDVKR